jgi:hypothetical protein
VEKNRNDRRKKKQKRETITYFRKKIERGEREENKTPKNALNIQRIVYRSLSSYFNF